jgi:Fe2+ or Zn2+ uptake regulation protein
MKEAQDTKFSEVDRLLEKFKLKKTELRRQIASRLMESSEPISQAQLIDQLSETLPNVDRVSVYRNLQHLKGAGFVHEVSENSYVACTHECAKHPHVLLFCQKCERHREIKDHDRIEKLMHAFKGLRFFADNQPLYIKGVCKACA